MRHLPVGTVYAGRVGIGSVGVAIDGILLFGERVSARRVQCLALIVAGVVGLELTE